MFEQNICASSLLKNDKVLWLEFLISYIRIFRPMWYQTARITASVLEAFKNIFCPASVTVNIPWS